MDDTDEQFLASLALGVRPRRISSKGAHWELRLLRRFAWRMAQWQDANGVYPAGAEYNWTRAMALLRHYKDTLARIHN